jgi:creatinine amidohydrolase
MEMTWQDIAGAETGRWIAMLPLAAVEQHGSHLPLGVDNLYRRSLFTAGPKHSA